MAPLQTTRLGVWYWESGTDEFTRDQMTDSHQALEDLVALFTSGLFSARPAASAINARGFYLATDTNVLYYSNGTAWFSVNSFASPSGLVPGDTNTDGTSTFATRADHKHSLPAWGVTGELQQVGTTANGGSAVKFARVDHAHTLAGNSVTSGKIAAGAISAANLFTAQVVERDAIKDGAINKAKLDPQAQIPSGTIWAYGGTTAPTGWLFCDGQSLVVSAQTDLFNAIGYQYGGSGANFNVPDLRDRMPRGSASTSSGLGVNAGSDTVTLATTNLPSHLHAVGTIAVANHTDHVHTLNGTGASAVSNSDAAHTHPVSAIGTNLADGTVIRFNGSTFLIFGGGNDPYQLFPPVWSGRPTNAGVFESGATLQNTALTVPAHNTQTSSADVAHGHTLTGNSGNNTATLTHTTSGSTANTGSGTAVTVTPMTQTVNYIIKT